MARNPVAYAPKQCEICDEQFMPTSGRQRVCTKPDCKRELERWRYFRRQQKYAAEHERPTEKNCDWIGCPVMIPVSWTGVLPKYCPPHYQQSIAPTAQSAHALWRLKTIDIECSHPICDNLQHPGGHGWCCSHYTIWSVHGLDADAWWGFYNQQDGKCPICHDKLLNGTTIAVDHDHAAKPGPRHKEEHTRGILHAAPCNGLILGGIETAIANGWLENALSYIEEHIKAKNKEPPKNAQPRRTITSP